VCASTYVNGNRRKFFGKKFSTLSRLDDAKNKAKITAPSPVHPPASYPNVATAKRLDNEDKGWRCHLHDHNLTATRNSEKNISAPAEKEYEGYVAEDSDCRSDQGLRVEERIEHELQSILKNTISFCCWSIRMRRSAGGSL
jgi:hypothetical protein